MPEFNPALYIQVIIEDHEITGVPPNLDEFAGYIDHLIKGKDYNKVALAIFKTRLQQLDKLIPFKEKTQKNYSIVADTKFAKMALPVNLDTPHPFMTKNLDKSKIENVEEELKALQRERKELAKSIKELERI